MLLAAIPALSSFVAPFRLPLLLVYLVLERVHRALRERHGIDRSAELVRAEREGEARVTAGNHLRLVVERALVNAITMCFDYRELSSF